MRNIAIVAGGYSSEYEVSLKSADNILAAIDRSKYNCYLLLITKDKWEVKYEDKYFPVDRNDFSCCIDGEKVLFDFAYITIHGTPGENGLLQGYLAMLNIPHSTCSSLSASLTFDKYMCNRYLEKHGINVPKALLLRNRNEYSAEDINKEIPCTCFVKPNSDGSSFGISKVTKYEDLQLALDKAFNFSNEIVVEKAVNGLEFTCGALKIGDKIKSFPITEIIPKNDFFDFEAKYDPNFAEEITPARISDELRDKIQEMTSYIYDILKCNGIIRVDYIIENDIVYVLEVNTTPGMTNNSFIPKQIAAMNGSLKDTISSIIENTLN